MATGNIDEIVQLIGFSPFRSLIEARGGTFVRIPSSLANAALLIQFVGQDAAGKLVNAYGGESIYVPNDKATPSARIRVLELAEAAPDLTHSQIALAVGCSETTVRKHLGRAKAALDCRKAVNG